MTPSRRSSLRVLIAGGGVAGLEAALALRALAEERVSVELLAPETDFTYRPLAVAEPFRVGEVRRFPLEPLVHAAGAELRRGALASVDPARRVVTTREGEDLSYDVLLLALGARPRQRLEHALAHLAGGFAGERDGDDLLGMLHRREEPQVALDQEPGLARARRRLHDERARGVERAAARGRIGDRGSAHRASSSSGFSRRS